MGIPLREFDASTPFWETCIGSLVNSCTPKQQSGMFYDQNRINQQDEQLKF